MAATVEFGLDAKQGLLDLRSETARLKLVDAAVPRGDQAAGLRRARAGARALQRQGPLPELSGGARTRPRRARVRRRARRRVGAMRQQRRRHRRRRAARRRAARCSRRAGARSGRRRPPAGAGRPRGRAPRRPSAAARRAHRVLRRRVGVGAGLEQDADGVRAAEEAREVQRGEAVARALVGAGRLGGEARAQLVGLAGARRGRARRAAGRRRAARRAPRAGGGRARGGPP